MLVTNRPLQAGGNDAIKVITDSVTFTGFWDLEAGQRIRLSVDHHEDAEYALAAAPEFAATEGCIFFLEMGGTDGSGFEVIAERTEETGTTEEISGKA